MRILDILKEFLKEVEKDNPFNLVLKGGTALSLYYLDHHRESEDLDFDAEKHFAKDHEKIKKFLSDILDKLRAKQLINDYKINKSDFAATNRYHIKIELKTHKIYNTKIDIDFVDLPNNFLKKGQLSLYTKERMFITKLITFIERKEFKDLYDIAHLLDIIDVEIFKKNENVAQLINDVIQVIQQEDINKMFKLAFRNVDLKFENLKETKVDKFTKQTIHKLQIVVNKIKK